MDEETDETLSDVAADTTPQATTVVPPATEAAADGGTSVEETPAEASEPAAEGERRATAPAAPAGLGLLFQAPDATAAPRRRRATAPARRAAPAASEAPARAEAPEAEETDRSAARATGRPESTESEVDADAEGDGGGRRRRRRGGKGRKARVSGDSTEADASSSDGQVPGEDTTAAATTAGDTGDTGDTGGADDTGPEDTEDNEGGPSRRRTRRRRRSGGGSGESEEQPGVVTRMREPRKERDEVTSVKGSTRLEAKKQRRREGREAGRRRTIITEAEFLARRESVERVMVVRNKDDRTQIAVLEDKVLVEHYVSRESNVSMAGNIYLGRVQNVLPSMEAAFVDIGKGRNAVLYAGEVNWDAAGLSGNRAKRIENALSSGDSVLVQVTKDPIGHKGARLTSQISLPGRYLVYVPDGNMTGISRKLPDTERARLKKILREIVPENAGVIVRTAAEGASEEELRADVARLTATWEDIKAKASSSQTKAPTLLHGEPDLTVRVIRDVFNEDFASLVVAGEPAWSQVSGYVSSVAPDLADRVTKWTGEQDLFTHYRVDEQIAKAMDRKVWLPSGGSLVIDRTEAMTVVDVNTGKFVGSGGNLEETVTKNNIEAAEEVVRQLRLRDIGGIIVIDFIDMVLESNRDLVVRRLLECLGRDRTKHQVAEVTSLGLVQMTRKRVGSGLIEVFSETCEHCNGRGFIIHADPVDQNNGNGSGSPRQRQPWRRQRQPRWGQRQPWWRQRPRRRRRTRLAQPPGQGRPRPGWPGSGRAGPGRAERADPGPDRRCGAPGGPAGQPGRHGRRHPGRGCRGHPRRRAAGRRRGRGARRRRVAAAGRRPVAGDPAAGAGLRRGRAGAAGSGRGARAAGHRRRPGGDRTGRRGGCGARGAVGDRTGSRGGACGTAGAARPSQAGPRRRTGRSPRRRDRHPGRRVC